MKHKFRLEVVTEDFKDVTVEAEGTVETEGFKVEGTIVVRKATLRGTLGWIMVTCGSAAAIAAVWGWLVA